MKKGSYAAAPGISKYAQKFKLFLVQISAMIWTQNQYTHREGGREKGKHTHIRAYTHTHTQREREREISSVWFLRTQTQDKQETVPWKKSLQENIN